MTRAGVHADGLLKNEEVYNIFDTGKILGRPPKVMISNTSGVSGIAVWINQYMKLTGDEAVTKSDPIVLFLKQWVDQQYDEGRVTAITDGELEEQMQIFASMQGDEEHLH